MKFKKLTESQIDYIIRVYKDKGNESWDKRADKLAEEFGVTQRTIRKWVSEKLKLKERDEVVPEQYTLAQNKEFDSKKKRFIITWAQNNTPVNTGLLKNIEAYAEYINASVHVIAGRYKNPTSTWTAEQEENEFWDEKVLKYLDANRHDIHKYVSIMSDIKVQPTAVNPMTGMQALSGVNSCIFGAPKVQMEMIPVLDGNIPKMMATTGSITEKNYTDSKSGKVGDFHHTFGFCIVEIKDDEVFFIRQVTADDKTGAFTDLYYNVSNTKVTRVVSIAAAVLGDLHLGHHDEQVLDTTLNVLFKNLKPANVVLHDVFDGHSISHHESKDAFQLYRREQDGTNSVKREVDNMLEWLKKVEKYNVTIVRSNHDDFIDRWLINNDWKKNIKNALEYINYASLILQGKAPKGIIPCLIEDRFPKMVTLDRSTSFKVKGWELGQHGDVGANGSRGSLLQFRKLNTKCVVGHYHSPGRKDGGLAVGTSTKLRVGYNIGPSSWLQSHVIIHEDGRAQHVNFLNGEFTTFK
jgi:predicted transcriptional regulator